MLPFLPQIIITHWNLCVVILSYWIYGVFSMEEIKGMQPIPPPPRFEPRCAIFDPSRPSYRRQGVPCLPCIINGVSYLIQKPLGRHDKYYEYLARIKLRFLSSFNFNFIYYDNLYASITNHYRDVPAGHSMSGIAAKERFVVLLFVAAQKADKLVELYQMQSHLLQSEGIEWDSLHLVPYYDESCTVSGDASFILVRRHYPDGTLSRFTTDLVQGLERVLDATQKSHHEHIAIHSWCQLVQQISAALQKYRFWVTMDNIYVQKNADRQSYDYVLGKLENMQKSSVAIFKHKCISSLVIVAWKYYALLSNPDILLDAEGNIIKESRQINTFGAQSKYFWTQDIGNGTQEEVKQEMIATPSAESMLFGCVRGRGLDTEDMAAWKQSVQSNLATFTTIYSVPHLLARSSLDTQWSEFNMQIKEICAYYEQ